VKLNLPQRVAVLLALGVVLHVSTQVILFEEPRVLIGDEPRYGGGAQGLLIAAHVGAWLVAALWLLRDRER
jgi:hypothetical protein